MTARLGTRLNQAGELVWRDGHLRGEDSRPWHEIRRTGDEALARHAERLTRSELRVHRGALTRLLDQILTSRSRTPDPPTLVNADVTPENLLIRRRKPAGLVDPRPMLDSGARNAAFFLFCYRFLLPSLHDTQRYARHRFDRHAPLLAAIADGFEESYLAGQLQEQAERLTLERAGWHISYAGECQALPAGELSEETHLRMGSRAAIAGRVQCCLDEIDGHCS